MYIIHPKMVQNIKLCVYACIKNFLIAYLGENKNKCRFGSYSQGWFKVWQVFSQHWHLQTRRTLSDTALQPVSPETHIIPIADVWNLDPRSGHCCQEMNTARTGLGMGTVAAAQSLHVCVWGRRVGEGERTNHKINVNNRWIWVANIKGVLYTIFLFFVLFLKFEFFFK